MQRLACGGQGRSDIDQVSPKVRLTACLWGIRFSQVLLGNPDKVPGIDREISAFPVCDGQGAVRPFVSHGKTQGRL